MGRPNWRSWMIKSAVDEFKANVTNGLGYEMERLTSRGREGVWYESEEDKDPELVDGQHGGLEIRFRRVGFWCECGEDEICFCRICFLV